MSEKILEIRHLSKTFGTNLVLKDIDFTVNSKDVTCIIGASGSGKSTLLRCLNLLETPTTGEILYHGNNIADARKSQSRRPCITWKKLAWLLISMQNQDSFPAVRNSV